MAFWLFVLDVLDKLNRAESVSDRTLTLTIGSYDGEGLT